MRQLPQSMLDDAPRYGRIQHYQQGQVIHLRGDSKPGLSIIISGVVKVGNFDLEGRYQLTALLKAGDTFGEFTLFTNLPRTHNSTAFTDSDILIINQSNFNSWMADCPEITRHMLTNVSQKLHTVLELLDDITRLKLHVRLAKIIQVLCLEQKTSNISLRQSDCAELLGVTVLSAHTALKKLTALGIVQSYYGGVEVKNIEELTQFVAEHSSLSSLE